MNNTTTQSGLLATSSAKAAVASVYATILVLVVILNLLAVHFVYKVNTERSTSFTIHMVHLFVVNIIACLIDIPFDILDILNSGYLTFIECAIYSFVNWAFYGVVVNCHLVISLNRLWAILRPFSYRGLHSARFAVVCCLIVWIYVLVLVVPIFIYRIASDAQEEKCLLDITNFSSKQSVSISAWDTATFIVVFFVPVVGVIGLFPFIEFKRRQRRRVVQTTQSNETPGKPVKMKPVSDPRAFRLLMALTFSLLFSWMPQLIWEAMQYRIEQRLDRSLYEFLDLVMDIVWTAQAALDPLLFIFVYRLKIRN